MIQNRLFSPSRRLWYLRFSKAFIHQAKPENLFLAIVLSITCFSSLAYGVNKPSWDVDVHFSQVIIWSNPSLKVELSAAEARMVYGWTWESHFSLVENQANTNRINAEASSIDGRVIEGSFSELYQNIAYLPGSIVYALGSALSLPFSVKYLLSRLAFALVYSFITFFGMKKLRSGKMLYAVIALLPTAIFLASNYNYDYWVNAFALFATACLIRELQTPDEVMSLKRMLLLLGAFVIGLSAKAIYFPIVLLCLLIPKRKFSSKKASRLFRAGTVVTALLIAASFAIPYFFVTGPGIGDIRGGDEVNSTEQIAFILSNPGEFTRILMAFLAEYYSFSGSRGYIAFYAYLGYSSWPLWVVAFGLMLFTALTDKGPADKAVCTWKSRTVGIVLNFITMAMIAAAFYVAFTAVGSETVAGCQPRYLIPVLFCTLVFLSSPRLAWPRKAGKHKTWYHAVVLGAMPFIYLIGYWQVYISLLV